MSKHPLTLHRVGVVTREPVGANVIYTLRDETALTVLQLTVESVNAYLRDLAKLASDSENRE